MKQQNSGPQPEATGAAQRSLDYPDSTNGEPDEQAREAERRKLDALATLRARNACRVLEAQRAMVRLVIERGTATIDDVRGELGLSDGERTHWLGSVPGELRRAGIIRRSSFTESRRATAHARPVSVWQLANAAAAQAWLVANDGESMGGG